MMYSFYASQCLGASMLMSPRVQHVLNSQRRLLLLALLRLPGVPMIFYHNSSSSGLGLFGNDYVVFIFYTVHMWLGGLVFCQSFTVATHLFDNKVVGGSRGAQEGCQLSFRMVGVLPWKQTLSIHGGETYMSPQALPIPKGK